jgi:WXG100 family type VII secretion target
MASSFTAMAERSVLQVQPEVMHVASQALSSADKDLHTQLVELNSQVRELLDGWQGGAGGAYAAVWDSWHRGAGEVQGLSTLAKAIGLTGVEFQTQESAGGSGGRAEGRAGRVWQPMRLCRLADDDGNTAARIGSSNLSYPAARMALCP